MTKPGSVPGPTECPVWGDGHLYVHNAAPWNGSTSIANIVKVCACGKRDERHLRSMHFMSKPYEGDPEARCKVEFPDGSRCHGRLDEAHEHWIPNDAFIRITNDDVEFGVTPGEGLNRP